MADFPIVSISSISASGIYISTYGEVQTAGVGRGTVAGNARGAGAVDLQVNRSNATEVASGAYSVVSGGQQNTGSGLYAVVTGGSQNTAIDQYSTVGGGVGNSALGDTSTVPGGRQNSASGAYSFAAGFASTSTSAGAFTWSDSQGAGVNNNVQDRTWFKNRGGFLVTGSTNSYMSGTLDRGVFITGDGLVGISTNVPRAALDIVSTGTLISQYAQIWRNSDGAVVASMTATGVLYPPQTAVGGGDNLGNHIATMALDMSNQQIMNVSSLTVTGSNFSVGVSTLIVMAGNVGVGSGGAAVGKFSVVVDNATGGGSLSAWDNTYATIGMDGTSGAALGFGYDQTNSAGLIVSAAPGIGWKDLRYFANQHILYRSGGVEAMRIDAVGGVGIGTMNPQGRLHVLSNSTTVPYIFVTSHTTTGFGLVVSTTGNSGFGTGNPQGRLHVLSNSTAAPYVFVTSHTTTGFGLVVSTTGNSGFGTAVPDQKLTVAGNISQTGVVISSGAGNNYFAGNVGIGTSSPGAKLDVQGGAIKATGGLVIETRTSDPGTPATGQLWLITP